MDTGELRRRILRALEDAKNDAAMRRTETDAAAKAYEDFLDRLAIPMLKQTLDVLKAEKEVFVLNAPAGSARIVSEGSSDTFLEFVLDKSGPRPLVLGRTSRARGRQRVLVDERPIVTDKAIGDITEEDVAAFLVAEVPKLVRR